MKNRESGGGKSLKVVDQSLTFGMDVRNVRNVLEYEDVRTFRIACRILNYLKNGCFKKIVKDLNEVFPKHDLANPGRHPHYRYYRCRWVCGSSAQDHPLLGSSGWPHSDLQCIHFSSTQQANTRHTRQHCLVALTRYYTFKFLFIPSTLRTTKLQISHITPEWESLEASFFYFPNTNVQRSAFVVPSCLRPFCFPHSVVLQEFHLGFAAGPG